ncbi:cytochrome b561 and DOMON domain-containing protein At5g47530-like [Juglans microcarpa x Juglans regia]|uniref:cytochrome b561 and DOMON domain-containing protein At5g47530-like n=1 Tax=Juglans microcarpa x Juglans regia TaxID=2249226 RepID=UPI001B7DCCD2|nr:cytochrome b561 and DOMON domain-containing protein At5g47530-like [Juglans microcarpa x Juglans regia]
MSFVSSRPPCLLANMFKPVLVFSVLLSLCLSSLAQTCSKYSFPSNQVFSSCNDLPYLNSFLHWNYNQSSGSLQIAFRKTGVTPSSWTAWAINPTGSGMKGAQALVAYQFSNGSLAFYQSQITSYATTMAESNLTYAVPELTATYSNSEIVIYATLALPNSITTINHVWQVGPVKDDKPQSHSLDDANTNSKGVLNLLSGEAGTSGGGGSRSRDKNVHGVLNVFSWGILMPIGVMIARYLKVFESADPAWFYLHASCQTTAYVIGVAGVATGIKLGNDSAGVEQTKHRVIGVLLFILATLQVFALLLRPKKDHKYRFYWNIYHHSVGYLVILLSIINIFKGFDILKPEKKWKSGYIAIVVIFIINIVWVEAYTWYLLRKKRSESTGKTHQGVNGAKGYGARPAQFA